MAYPISSGAVSLSGGYIPEVWAPKLLVKFYEKTILAQVSNTDYEGMIQEQGDTVNIQLLPDITIFDHAIGQDLDYENPSPSSTTLDIDKGKGYAFAVPTVSKKQSMIDFVNKWTEDASKQMKISMERSIFADIYSDADSTNAGATAGAIQEDIDLGSSGSPIALTSTNIVDYLVERVSVCLDENDVPDDDRFAIIPAWMAAKMKTSELKEASLTGDGKSTLRTGKVGELDRFSVYSSNLLATTSDGSGETAYNLICGQKSALTFAAQLTENEIIDNPKAYGKLARGLMVYGYQVVKGTALVHGYVYKG